MTEKLIKTEIDERVLTIQLNRPKAMNALSPELLREIAKTLQGAEHNSEIGAVIIQGDERAFAAGADIAVMAELSEKEASEAQLYVEELSIIDRFPKPIIAAVSGYALGGGFELALLCDIMIVANDATLGLPEITLGVIPGMGGTQRLTRIVGKSKANQMIMTGEFITGEQAHALGIASVSVESAEIFDHSRKLAKDIANRPQLALQAAKASVSKALETSLEDGIKFEAQQFFGLFDTEDKNEGMRAFLEKRKPKFNNR